ncbi:nitroreductase family protein [Anditalea andensis]|nr:hypothetical protein [Anditalea andensis]
MDLLEAMQWRYASKKYGSKKASGQKLERTVSAIILSASSGKTSVN